jgi:hypothetical protein
MMRLISANTTRWSPRNTIEQPRSDGQPCLKNLYVFFIIIIAIFAFILLNKKQSVLIIEHNNKMVNKHQQSTILKF